MASGAAAKGQSVSGRATIECDVHGRREIGCPCCAAEARRRADSESSWFMLKGVAAMFAAFALCLRRGWLTFDVNASGWTMTGHMLVLFAVLLAIWWSVKAAWWMLRSLGRLAREMCSRDPSPPHPVGITADATVTPGTEALRETPGISSTNGERS